MAEEPLYFPADGFRLFGVLHTPEADARGYGVVFCAPFAEEHKQGYRVFADMARRLEAQGFACLRFDYRGTGDSEGPFTAFTLAGAVRDIGAAAELLRQRAGVQRIGLVGLRLGASLAWRAAEEVERESVGRRESVRESGRESVKATEPESESSLSHAPTLPPSHSPTPGFDRLVLWQPIVDGALFYRLSLRRMLVRQMMTSGKASGERATGDQATIDLDGFLASRAMCEEIKALDLTRHSSLPPRLLVQFAHAAEPSAELRPLVDKLRPEDRFLPFVLEPFWDRLGYIDCTAAVEATVAWLAGQA